MHDDLDPRLEPPVPTEVQKVEGWRLGELLDAGFPLDVAEQIATSPADLHEAVRLAAAGCPHRLVAEILL